MKQMKSDTTKPGRPGSRRFRWTIRTRLTLLHGALFLAAGVALLAVTYTLALHPPTWADVRPPEPPEPTAPGGAAALAPQPSVPAAVPGGAGTDRDQLLVASACALALLTVLSAGLGWLVAGRALRPLRAMADTVRSISAHDLHRRLATSGPADEVSYLADTFDALLDRLEEAFQAQRRFVANASHELRTPLAYERNLLEIALSRPGSSAAHLRDACRRVLASNQRQGQLIDALLTLARGQQGPGSRSESDLAVLAGPLLTAARSGAGARLRLASTLRPAPVAGDPRLLERLLANLLDNAVRYNVDGGTVDVRTQLLDGRPTLEVRNTGPVIPPAEIGRLFQPFQRLQPGRTGGGHGHGLGLSIVAAVTAAHGAELHAGAPPDGGLTVRVTFARPCAVPAEPGGAQHAPCQARGFVGRAT
jgi:signal transduction histidine kinase